MKRIESNVLRIGCAVTMAALVLCPEISRADESGISFWLPGQYGSLAAVPQTPGWALGAIYYHTSVTASGAAAAAREIQVGRFSPTVNVNLNLNLSGQADLVFLAPSYTFAQPVLGGQLAVSLASVWQERRKHRRNADGSRPARGHHHAHGSAFGLAGLGWGFVSDRDAALEQRRQQLHGLCHRRCARR